MISIYQELSTKKEGNLGFKRPYNENGKLYLPKKLSYRTVV